MTDNGELFKYIASKTHMIQFIPSKNEYMVYGIRFEPLGKFTKDQVMAIKLELHRAGKVRQEWENFTGAHPENGDAEIWQVPFTGKLATFEKKV